MAVEQTAIVDAFKNEGLDEGIAEGLNFETDESMKSWIGKYKDSTSFHPESLDKFTPEQLIEMANKRQSKSMQSLIDKLKDDAKKKVEEEWNKTHSGSPTPVTDPPVNKGSGIEQQLKAIAEQNKFLLEWKENIEKTQKEKATELSVSEKKKSILDGLKKNGCNNEDVLEFVELKMQVNADSNAEDCIKEGKKLYDEKYKKLYGGNVYSPVSKGGIEAAEGKPSEAIKKIKERTKERIKKLSL